MFNYSYFSYLKAFPTKIFSQWMLCVITLLTSLSFYTPYAHAAAPQTRSTTPGIWKYQNASVYYSEGHVFLTLDGTKRVVANEELEYLDPSYAQTALVSPDKKWLLYVSTGKQGWDDATIQLVDLATLGKTTIGPFVDSFWPQVRWSPDSTQVAYVLVDAKTGQPEIYTTDIQTLKSKKAVSKKTFTKKSLQGYEDGMFMWAADNKSIIYYDDALNPGVKYVVPLTTGTTEQAITVQSAQVVGVAANSIPSTPCNAPLFSQVDPAWSGNLMYDAANYRNYNTPNISPYDVANIGNEGCAVTSATMLVDYYARSSIHNPASMNYCLGNDADGLNWPIPASRCSQGKTAFTSSEDFSWGKLNSELRNGHPVIVGVAWNGNLDKTHFFLVVSGDYTNNADNYTINDPATGTRRLLSDITVNQNGWLSWIRTYSPTAAGPWPECKSGNTSTPPATVKQDVYTYVGHTVNHRLEVFARGSNNNIWHRFRNNSSSWSNWSELEVGGVFQGNPAVGISNDGTSSQIQEVFARGWNNNIYHIWQIGPDGAWTKTWQPLQTGYTFQGTPTVGHTSDGRLEVYARSSDNNILHNYQLSGGGWSGWSPLQSGGVFLGDPAVAINPDGSQEVFARGWDNNIYHIWQVAPNGSWTSSWQPLQSNKSFHGTPAIGYTDNDGIEIYAKGADNNIYHNWKTGNSWNGWVTFQNGLQFSGDPAVNINNNGCQEVFAVGNDHALWHIWKTTPGGSWVNTWENLQPGHTFQGTPAAQLNIGGSQELFVIDDDVNALWHNWQDAGHHWSGWYQFDGQQGLKQ